LAPLEISYMKFGQVGLVTAQGGLVLGPPVESLRQTLDNLISHGDIRIVLNLAGINRLDSSGIGLLVKVLQSCKGAGGDVKLASLPKVVAQTLSMCRLLPLFEVFDQDQEAIASFG
jgi:anti-sigma B factor antagonist